MQVIEITGTWKDVIWNKYILVNTILLTLLFFCEGSSYYLINFELQFLSGDFYLNSVFSAISEGVAYLVGGLLAEKAPLKFSMVSMFLLSFIGAVLYLILNESHPFIVQYFVFAMKFGIAANFNIVIVLAIVLFPSQLRGLIFGMCNIFSRIGSFLAPLLAEMPEPIPAIIIAVVSGLGVFLTLLLINQKVEYRMIKKN